MDGMLLPLALGGGIGLAALVLRSKGVHVFLMLCAGFELNRLYGADLTGIVRDIANGSSLPIDQIVAGVLLFLPAALVVVLSRKQAKKKKLPVHALGALVAGWLGTLWAAQVVIDNLPSSPIYTTLLKWQVAALAVGIVAALLLAFLERPKPDEATGKKHAKG